jgi:murein DD-endopeptidase MepM/ murein hydrolase activator NlpD
MDDEQSIEQKVISSEDDVASKFSGAVKVGKSVNEVYENIVIGGDVVKGGQTIGDQVENLINARKQDQPEEDKNHEIAPVATRLPKGLGVYLFSLDRYKGLENVIQNVLEAQLGHVIFKIAQGTDPYPFNKERLLEIVRKLKENKIEVWGLHYLLGKSPEEEARVAIEMMAALECDGYLADIEIEFEEADLAESSKKMAQFFKAVRPPRKARFPLGILTFDSPSRRRTMPWTEMLQGCDFIAPMIAIGQQNNASSQLSRSVVEFAELFEEKGLPQKPYIPVGLADVGKATPTDLLEFVLTTKKLSLPGIILSDSKYLFDEGELQNYLPRLADEIVSITYVVKPGDTLTGIALRYNITVNELLESNNLVSPNLIMTGMTLKIPTGEQVVPYSPPSPEEVDEEPKKTTRKTQKKEKPTTHEDAEAKTTPEEETQTETITTETSKYPSLPAVTEPEVKRNYLQIIHNDEVEKVEDKLDFDKYAQSFAQMVLDERTAPPLTVGISGAWGSGKSFILRRVYELLIPPPKRSENAKWHHRFWNWLKGLILPGPKPRVYAVRFNAWDYNAYDAIWPGLVRHIFETLEKGNGPGRKAFSRFRRNLHRQWQGVKSKLIPWMAITAAIAIFLYFRYGQEWQHFLGYILTLGIGTLVTNIVTIVSKPMASWIINLVAEGHSYGTPTGYMEEIREDIDMLQKGLTPGTKIVIFIDDLDRCAAEKIVSTLESIKLLLNFKIFIVFIAVDSSVIARAIEKQYKEIYAEAGRSGYFYLDKIIQIPFRIPEPNNTKVNNYLDTLLTVANYSQDKNLEPQSVDKLCKELARLKLLNGVQFEDFKKFATLLPYEAKGVQEIINEVQYRIKATVEEQIPIPQELSGIAAVWALLARWWPMSTYLMHNALHGQIGGTDIDPNLSALETLYHNLQSRTEVDVQVLAIRQNDGNDAMLARFENVVANAPTFTLHELATVLQGWQTPYVSTIGFDRKESGAFKNLTEYLKKNPRHIKRLVNTFSLIRVLARRSPEGETILNAPETMLRWLIISSQWPVTAQVMLEEFENELQSQRTDKDLRDDDDALKRLYEKAMARFADKANEELSKERFRLDDDPDTLDNCIYANLGTLTSKRFDILRAYSINFNPAEDNLPLFTLRATPTESQPATTP